MRATDAGSVVRRRGKEWRERAVATVLMIAASPLFAVCTLAIKIEGLFDSSARGPVFLREDRISRGRVIKMLKFRTLNRSALESLPPGPTHIAHLERSGELTRSGRLIRQWYLDELPQLWHIVRGDMFLIGTRPYPLELYEEEMKKGVTRKRDMPAGLIGPVQSFKGEPSAADEITLDAEYWEAFKTLSPWKLLVLDWKILRRSVRVQLEHKGI